MLAELGDQSPPPRCRQLVLLLEGVHPGDVHPLHRHGRRRKRVRPPTWAPPLPQKANDDPRVCPLQTPGQLVLLRIPRAFTIEDAQRIRGRHIPELDSIRPVIDQMRTDRRRSEAWTRLMIDMVRLALAAREPAEHLVGEEDIDVLPSQRGALIEVFRRAGLLRRRTVPGATRLPPRPRAALRQRMAPRGVPQRSCELCLSWSGGNARICAACKEWRRRNPAGRCRRCGDTLPVRDHLCRFCHQVLAEHSAGDTPVDQLWFGGALAVQLRDRRPGGRYGTNDRRRTLERTTASAREPAPLLSQHLVEPDQLVLVPDLRRDWTRVDFTELPALTPTAQRLLDEFTEIGRTERWTRDTLWANLRGLRLVLAWVGAAAPIPEADVAAVTSAMNCTVRRVVQFLNIHGLLIPDPARAIDPHHAAVQRMVADLPTHLAPEVTAWVQVLRGEGRKPSLVMRWQTIRQYVGYALPTLKQWGQQGDSLRGITVEDVRSAIKNHPGPGHQQLGALRSFFRALKRERLIFQDPSVTSGSRASSRIPFRCPPTDCAVC